MVNVHDKAFQQQVKMELARREFWEYCKFTSPDFYKEDRRFLVMESDFYKWLDEQKAKKASL